MPDPVVCKHPAGLFEPVIDRRRCEGKADCVRVCPHQVFVVDTLPPAQRHGLGLKGQIKGFVHRWQQAFAVRAQACEACGVCISACPEDAITLRRRPSA